MRRLIIVLLILLVAVAWRETAARRMRTDFDEPVYLTAGARYAGALRYGDLARLANDDFHYEHPGLMKLVYAAALLPFGETAIEALPLPELTELADLPPPLPAMVSAARHAAMLFSLLTVLLLAVVSPAAGTLLAVHTYAIKYTTQIYLEALPMLMATVCVLAYVKAQIGGRRLREWEIARISQSPILSISQSPLLWLIISAIALGLTAAGKYIYCVAGLAVAADWLWRLAKNAREQRRKGAGEKNSTPAPLHSSSPLHPCSPAPLRLLLAWGALALLVFYAANPNLWPDPLGRLGASLAFHLAYPSSAVVANVGYPWWQPFVWLLRPMPALWHPGLFPIALDGLTTLLGVAGSARMWRRWGGRGRVVVLWWLIGLIILLLWPTKWPQYSLIITVPLCLCAAEALRGVAQSFLMAAGRRESTDFTDSTD